MNKIEKEIKKEVEKEFYIPKDIVKNAMKQGWLKDHVLSFILKRIEKYYKKGIQDEKERMWNLLTKHLGERNGEIEVSKLVTSFIDPFTLREWIYPEKRSAKKAEELLVAEYKYYNPKKEKSTI